MEVAKPEEKEKKADDIKEVPKKVNKAEPKNR